MSDARAPLPAKTARVRSPGLPRERAQRLRVAWFIIGTLFGLAVGMLFHGHAPAENPGNENAAVNGGDVDAAAARQHSENAPAAEDANLPWPREVEVSVSSGDTLLDLLTAQGLTYDSAHRVMGELKSKFDPRDLKVGHTINMVLGHDDARQEKDAARIIRMNIILSDLEEVSLSERANGRYVTERARKKILMKPALGSSRITSSFYLAAKRAGVPDSVILELIKNYSYDVDFQRDIKVGDRIEVLYESLVTEEGIKVGTGQVLYAMLHTDGRDKVLYHYKGADGQSRYYAENGESIIKKLLRTPVDGARITSGFGMRFHPLLGYSRMHRGIDFGAPIGTPIYAAGDGVIEYLGPANGYGNLVKIRHNAEWSTAYGHMCRFAGGLHKGSPVRQGQVIAYVGQAGMATGPHLHYEILKDGAQVNPSGVQFAGGNRLEGRDLAAFKASVQRMRSSVAELGGGKQVADAR